MFKTLDKSKIVSHNFPESQYIKEERPKTQIVLHHTVSPDGIIGDINWWTQTPERIATPFIVDRAGVIHQCFSSKHWASHLGVKASTLKDMGYKDYGKRNVILDQGSIGIELDSWGGLIEYNGAYRVPTWDAKLKKNVPNKGVAPIPKDKVVVLSAPFRGYIAFEKYTKEQIDSTMSLIEYLGASYGIKLAYNDSIWDVSKLALSGKPGVWSHVSYRSDKSDCYPDPYLIQCLKQLK